MANVDVAVRLQRLSNPTRVVEEVQMDAAAGKIGPGTLVGRDRSGFFAKADDTQALGEVGVHAGNAVESVDSAESDGFHRVKVERGVHAHFKIATLTTDANARLQYGKWVSALFNDEVQLGGGSFANWVGTIVGHVSVTEVIVFVPVAARDGIVGVVGSIAVASATIENTSGAKDFNQTISIPANRLQVGDVIHVQASVRVLDNNSTDTLTVILDVGGISVATSGAVDVADDDFGVFDVYITVRTVGAGGTMVAAGMVILDAEGTALVSTTLPSSALDTTAAVSVKLTANWAVVHADNQVRQEQLFVEVLRAA